MARAGLTPQLVVAEAALIADEVGLDQLTLAAVAKRLGVAVPSLYKHIGGLDDLHRQLATLATAELGAAITTAAVGKAGGDALRAIADAYRDYARRHPGRYPATLRAPDPTDAAHIAAAESILTVVFAVLAGYDVTGPDAVDATRGIRSTLHGFVALEALGGFGMPQDVDRSFARMINALDAALASWT